MTLEPGIHQVPAADYYADGIADEPSLNATVLKAFIAESPLHAWTAHPRLNPDYAEKTDTKFDLGTVVHALFLQGEQITEQPESFIVADESVRLATVASVDGKPFALIADADDWRTNAAKDVRDEARARGLAPMLAGQWAQARRVVAAIRPRLAAIDTGHEPALFAVGKAERTLVWRDRDVLCRARLDWLHDDLSTADDLKSTGRTANPNVWSHTTMWSIGAEIQAALTLRGLRAALGVDSTFRFAIAELEPPYAVSAVALSASSLNLINQRIDNALDRWKRCLETGEWPGYEARVRQVDAPEWLVVRWAEMGQLAVDFDDEAVAA